MDEERGEWSSVLLPQDWTWEPFDRLFEDVTDSRRKLPQKDYLQEGRFPVIDQGETLIGGYSNDDSLVQGAAPPYIVFGDHTRCIKFIDSPFVQGADGVKVLKAKVGVDPRFAYLALRAIELPDKGYSRHMKFLRKSVFPLCRAGDQRRIVVKLERLLERSKSAHRELDRIPKLVARYKRAVIDRAYRGELTANWRERHSARPLKPARLEHVTSENIRNGLSVRGSDSPPGIRSLRLSALRRGVVDLSDVRYLPITSLQAERFSLREGDVLVSRGNGTKAFVGLAAIVRKISQPTIFPDTSFRIRIVAEKASPDWLTLIWNATQVRVQIEDAAKTTAGIWKISQADLAKIELMLPSIEEQREIVRLVDEAFSSINSLDIDLERAIALVDRLDRAMMLKAFSGELVTSHLTDEAEAMAAAEKLMVGLPI